MRLGQMKSNEEINIHPRKEKIRSRETKRENLKRLLGISSLKKRELISWMSMTIKENVLIMRKIQESMSNCARPRMRTNVNAYKYYFSNCFQQILIFKNSYWKWICVKLKLISSWKKSPQNGRRCRAKSSDEIESAAHSTRRSVSCYCISYLGRYS